MLGVPSDNVLTTTYSPLTYYLNAEQEQLESYFSHLELEFQFDEVNSMHCVYTVYIRVHTDY